MSGDPCSEDRFRIGIWFTMENWSPSGSNVLAAGCKYALLVEIKQSQSGVDFAVIELLMGSRGFSHYVTTDSKLILKQFSESAGADVTVVFSEPDSFDNKLCVTLSTESRFECCRFCISSLENDWSRVADIITQIVSFYRNS